MKLNTALNKMLYFAEFCIRRWSLLQSFNTRNNINYLLWMNLYVPRHSHPPILARPSQIKYKKTHQLDFPRRPVLLW